MSDEQTDAALRRPSPGGGFEETEARQRRIVLTFGALAVLAVLVLLVLAFVPRTVASGGDGEDAWALRVSPGILSPTVRFDTGGSTTVVDDYSMPASLADTAVLQAPEDAPAVTVVVGPTPRGVDSVRVTSLERGVGEAAIERVLWRRVHVAVLPDDVWVTDLVSIARDGGVIDTVRDLPAPSVPDPQPSDDPLDTPDDPLDGPDDGSMEEGR